ncbi:MAG: adenine deaminase C-terminal domain-containing protein [Liquorilactobacillus ghanensis]|uniref:adenine deaminase C-terminal domain-containing protein n=1 Tax=Liquorilactobacillus ghanensis TaxID=399370 RepID=UPI0039EAFF2C
MTKVDLLIKNGKVFNSYLRKFVESDVAIKGGKFYWVACDIKKIEPKKVLNLGGKYIIPGLVDSHMHIESSMTTPAIMGQNCAKYGTTTIIADDHEIANVAGIKGLKKFMSQKSPVDIFFAIPSSVPSTTPEMETTGGLISEKEIIELLKDPQIICLGEAMNFQGITSDDDSLIKRLIKICREQRPTMPLEGHCPKYSGEDLAKFIYSGITSDHTQQTSKSILEKVENGMFVQLQKKSMTKEVINAVINYNLFEHVALVTDDIMPDDLLRGHLNLLVKRAIEFGMKPEDAIYISSYTPARRMGLWDRGAIAPGRVADFIVLNDLQDFEIQSVYKNGILIESEEKAIPEFNFGPELLHSIKADKLTVNDIELKTNLVANGAVIANVIQISKVGTFTKRVQRKITVQDHRVLWHKSGLALLFIQERYGKTDGQLSYGLVEGALSGKGAIGATWAHDHHNLMVIGTDLTSMILVQNQLVKQQGGYIAAIDNKITANAPLPVGGVVSQAPISLLGKQIKQVRSAMNQLGYINTNEIMSFSTLSLLVSQEIKMSDKGMFDVKTQNKIPLFNKDETNE